KIHPGACNARVSGIFARAGRTGVEILPCYLPGRSVGKIGMHVLIVGRYFIGTTSVGFGGVNARFQVLNAGNILATVPDGAQSGPLAVTNAGGTAASKNNVE